MGYFGLAATLHEDGGDEDVDRGGKAERVGEGARPEDAADIGSGVYEARGDEDDARDGGAQSEVSGEGEQQDGGGERRVVGEQVRVRARRARPISVAAGAPRCRGWR